MQRPYLLTRTPPSGLERLVADILRASKNDPAKYSALVSSLSQPVPAEWFRNTFGDDGDMMSRDYPDAPPRVMSALTSFFVKVRDEKFTEVTAHKREAACDDDSGGIDLSGDGDERAPRASL